MLLNVLFSHRELSDFVLHRFRPHFLLCDLYSCLANPILHISTVRPLAHGVCSMDLCVFGASFATLGGEYWWGREHKWDLPGTNLPTHQQVFIRCGRYFGQEQNIANLRSPLGSATMSHVEFSCNITSCRASGRQERTRHVFIDQGNCISRQARPCHASALYIM